MKESKNVLKEQTLRVVETASKFSHDISGKAHILQFCLDEVLEKRPELGNDKVFSKLVQSMEDLCEIVAFFRDYLPHELDLESNESVLEVCDKVRRLLKVYHWKKMPSITLEFPENDILCKSCWELGESLFSIFSYCLDELDFSQAEPLEVKTSMELQAENQKLFVQIDVNRNSISLDSIISYFENASYRTKTMRSSLGFKLAGLMDVRVVEKGDHSILSFIILNKID